MSFNIIAETSKKLDFEKLHQEIYTEILNFDLVPMPGLGINGGDALGICIPLNKANKNTWIQLKPVLKILRSKFDCDVYDLYGGQKVNFWNTHIIKNNLLMK